ncbi:MAG: glycosyltransferase [Candidatus Omnitrophica bacterium]|nr:glycosyltransferase [Candidatus Omnitrophota bacterium]MDD5690524.1 glycosyltransferase [Candidatus Omnitrophota bacterium]
MANSKNKRIIFITREGYHLSGARVRCYNFACELKKLGLDTQVFSFGDHLAAKYGEEESQMPFRKKIYLNISAIKKLAQEKGSVFFIQRLNYHSLAPVFVSLFRRNKIIFDCDDWNIREDPVYYFGLYPSSKMEFLTRGICGYANVCTTASMFLKEYFGKFSRKIYYLPTGVDTDLFKPQPDIHNDSAVRFSWVGTIYHREMYENVRFILDCFSVLAKQHENIFLYLAGSGSYFKDIFEQAKSLFCADRIAISSWIHPDKMPDYLSHMDIGLLPLIQDSKFNQAKSPTKLFEYMALAKPVVASKMGEAELIIKDGKTGFLASNKEDFVYYMKLLIDGVRLRNDLGYKARKEVETGYSLKVLGCRLKSILDYI